MFAAVLSYLWNFSLIGKLLLLVLSLVLLKIGAIISRFVFVPKQVISYYAKQGLKAVIFPGADPRKALIQLANEKGSCLYPWTEFVNKYPNEPAFVSNMGPFVNLQLTDPKLVKEYYEKELEFYKKSHNAETLKLLFEGAFGFIPYAPWKARRRLYSQAFHFEFLKDNLPIIDDLAIRFCNRVHPSKNKNFLAMHEIKDFTGMVTGQLFFGEDLSEVKIEGENIIQYLADLCDRMLGLFSSAIIFLFGHRLIKMRLFSEHREFFRRKAMLVAASKKLIAKKEQQINNGEGSQKNNLLQIFIKAKKDPELQRETECTDDSIVAEFMGFFFAGVDTTSSLINSSIYFLCEYPHIAAKIREEIAPHWKVGQPLTYDIVNQFEYLYAFLKEVLRMSSITIVVGMKEAAKDHMLGNIKVKKGTLVGAGNHAMSHHPKYYKNPLEFDPSRFLRKDPEELFNFDPFIFIPFSAGRQNCIGQHLAYLKARVLLTHLLMRYNLEFPEGYKKGWTIDHALYSPLTPLRPVLIPRA